MNQTTSAPPKIVPKIPWPRAASPSGFSAAKIWDLSFLCILGELDPVGGKAQPIILIQLADRSLGLLAAFLSFLTETICIGIGHGDRDNAEK